MAGRRPVNLIRAALLLAVLLPAGCGPGPEVESPQALGGLQITCEPANALLYVDDRYMGSVASLARTPLPLPVGQHRLELRSEGHFAHFAEVTVARGVRHRLEVKLRKEPF